jgi:6-phosphogluconate dehydrogenase (decarboxylating)
MRKSLEVPISLLTAVALASIGCHRERHCVDAQNHLVPDSACQQKTGGAAGFHYVDGGSSGGHVGDTVVGASESGVSRGGFGGDGGDGGE